MSQGEPHGSDWVEASGKTVAEATEAALELLGVASADEAEVEIVEEPQRGLLGVIGTREARVRACRKTDRSKALVTLLESIVSTLAIPGASVTSSRDDEGYIHLSVNGPNLGILIGRRGETLDTLQYLLNIASTRLPGPAERVVLDAGGYRDRRRATLESLADRIVERVRRSGEEVVLEPMTPQERKVIHLYVSSRPGATTESQGEDPYRRVVVKPEPAGHDPRLEDDEG